MTTRERKPLPPGWWTSHDLAAARGITPATVRTMVWRSATTRDETGVWPAHVIPAPDEHDQGRALLWSVDRVDVRCWVELCAVEGWLHAEQWATATVSTSSPLRDSLRLHVRLDDGRTGDYDLGHHAAEAREYVDAWLTARGLPALAGRSPRSVFRRDQWDAGITAVGRRG